MLVTFSLKELRQFTVVAAVNKVLFSKGILKQKVMKNTISFSLLKLQLYFVNTGSMLIDSVLVTLKVIERKIRERNM